MDENVLTTKQFGGNTANKEKKLSVKSVLKLCSIVLYRFTQSFFQCLCESVARENITRY